MKNTIKNYIKYFELKQKEKLSTKQALILDKEPNKLILHVKCSFNNTVFTVTDLKGNTLMWSSPSCYGLKGSRRSTTFASRVALVNIAKRLNEYNIEGVDLRLKGLGPGRRQITKILGEFSIEVKSIEDVTPLPFNGTKKRVKRRI